MELLQLNGNETKLAGRAASAAGSVAKSLADLIWSVVRRTGTPITGPEDVAAGRVVSLGADGFRVTWGHGQLTAAVKAAVLPDRPTDAEVARWATVRRSLHRAYVSVGLVDKPARDADDKRPTLTTRKGLMEAFRKVLGRCSADMVEVAPAVLAEVLAADAASEVGAAAAK